MLSIKNYILWFILCNVTVQIKALVELPDVEDNNIGASEAIIRNTVNKIFALFKIQDVKHKPRLKHYSTIHNFFVSITLTDGNNLKEIAKLTRVNNFDNNTLHFIAQINEVLNEDDKSYDSNDTNNLNVTKYISMFIRKLKFLKERYVSNRNTVINTDILKYLIIDDKPLANETEIGNIGEANDTEENTLGDNEFWQTNGRRIYQGIRTTIKKFPFIASVLFFKKFQCAGSIIKNDLVITSASCLQLRSLLNIFIGKAEHSEKLLQSIIDDSCNRPVGWSVMEHGDSLSRAWNNRFFRENPAFLSVQVGSDVYEGGGDNIGVIELYFYPKYDPKTLRNNLAIMRLARKIAFKEKQHRVKKIDFDKNSWPMPTNSPRITVVGWGARDGSNIISDPLTNKLSYAELDYYPLVDCQDHYSVDFVTEKNFCAGFISKGAGACNRDAGGPGIIDNTLYGVISFGSPICGAPDAPTVFTKLGFYVDWIETIMEQSVATKFAITTTYPPNMFFDLTLKMRTKTTLKLEPILLSTVRNTPTPNHLRIVQDQGFKDFLETMFSNDDIKEYFDKSLDNTNYEMNNSGESDFDEKLKEEINKSQKNIKRKVTKSKHKHTTIPTTTEKVVESSDEFKSDKEQDVSTITESERKVTVLDNVSDISDDKNLEEDIMTLIDNLDIDSILKPKLLEESQDKEKKKAKSHKIFKKKGKENNVASNQSGESHANITSKQSVLNFIFLSEENKDKQDDGEGGLSIDADLHFKDLTFRDRPLRSNITKHDVLSETALYELISIAIDEEAKRLRKGKRYTL